MEKLVTVLWGFLILAALILGVIVYGEYKDEQFRKSSITAMNEQNKLLFEGNNINKSLISNVFPR